MNIIDELLDLKKSFEDNKDYKGYMVKQIIDARLKADEVRSDLVATDPEATSAAVKSASKALNHRKDD